MQSKRRVLVSGASSGVGQSVAAIFADEGATVVNLDVADGTSSRTLCGERFHTVRCDLGDALSIGIAMEDVDRLFGDEAPELLVCSAAISRGGTFLDVPIEDVDAQLAVNVRGLFVLGQEAGRRMRVAGGGQIIVVTSIAAFQAWQQESVYGMTKAAQGALVQAMAVELAPFGIMVNAIAPGPLEARSPSMTSTRSDPAVLRHDLERIPQQRFGRAEEIARAIRAMTDMTWMTGQTIVVDGGFMASGLAYFGEARARLTSKPIKGN